MSGDESVMTVLYNNYASSLYGLILRVVLDEAIAADVLQDAFVKIWKNGPLYDIKKGTLFTWMLNISRNTAIDAQRKIKREREVKNQNASENVYMSASEIKSIEHIGINELIDKLPAEQQIIIDYLYYKGYTQQELSEELDLPLGTVKTRARNAIKELKKYFNLILSMWI